MSLLLSPSVSRRLLLCAGMLAALCGTPAGQAQTALPPEMAWSMPADDQAALIADLTPLDDVLKKRIKTAEAGDSGVILLDERLIRVDERGRRVRVWHFVYKTLTDAGVKSNSEDTFTFIKVKQRPKLLLARTHTPEGTRIDVRPNAVLVQTPQRQAQYSLYDDQAEVRVIFPDVRPGSVTEIVMLIEDLETEVPGEFNLTLNWAQAQWGEEQSRYIVEIPTTLLARTQMHNVGAGIPTPTRETRPNGRERITWLRSATKGVPYEVRKAPSVQVGPVTHLTSLDSWDRVSGWYHSLAAGRDQLDDELKARIKEWTGAATTPAERIAALHARIADDIRYVGLEFGAASYQPHSCNDVWKNGYGDCKDKANLLAAALRFSGVPAHLALLNTEHRGLIDRRAPMYTVFDHAIVAIETSEGWLFCDPTAQGTLPGQIGTRNSDRDILVLKGPEAVWARTPVVNDGAFRFHFDLTREKDGSLSGWYERSASGYNGAWLREYIRKLEPVDRKSAMAESARAFFPAAEVVDTEVRLGDRGGNFVCRAFLTLPATGASNTESVLFPASGSVLPNLGTSQARTSDYFLDRETIEVSFRLRLPQDRRTNALTAPFQATNEHFSIEAAWTASGEALEGKWSFEGKSNVLAQTAFSQMYRSFQSLRNWLTQPIALTAGTAPSPAPTSATNIDLPLMPTGDGQVDLVDKKYPESGSATLRKAALEKVLQLFPDDASAQFRAGGRLAILDWRADRNQEAADRLLTLIERYQGKITPELIGWGQLYRAWALRDAGADAQAIALFETIVRDPALSDSRRAEAAPYGAILLEKTDQQKALELVLLASELPQGATPYVEALVTRLYLQLDRKDAALEHLSNLWRRRPEQTESLASEMLNIAHNWAGPRRSQLRQSLVAMINGTLPSVSAKVQTSIQSLTTFDRIDALRSTVRDSLKQGALAARLGDVETTPTPAEIDQVIDKTLKNKESRKALAIVLRSLAEHDLREDFPKRLWQAYNFADWVERQKPDTITKTEIDQLYHLAVQLPENDDYFIETQLIHGQRLRREGKADEEVSLLRGFLQRPDLSVTYDAFISAQLIERLLEKSDVSAALPVALGQKRLAAQNKNAARSYTKGILLLLHSGRFDEAKAAALAVKNDFSPDQEFPDVAFTLKELISMAESESGVEFWRIQSKLFDPLRGLLERAQVKWDDSAVFTPLRPKAEAWGEELKAMDPTKERAGYFRQLVALSSIARWIPSLRADLGEANVRTMASLGAEGQAYREWLIQFLSTPAPFNDPKDGMVWVWLAAHQVESGKSDQALKTVEEFRSRLSETAPTWPNMVRMHMAAARIAKAGAEKAILDGEQSLKDPAIHGASRLYAVRWLADLYRQKGDPTLEISLLRRELENPEIKANDDSARELRGRLLDLEGAKDLTAEFDAVLKTLDLGWLDYTEPRSLEDPRLRDLENVLKSPERQFKVTEQVKVHLLAARDPRRTFQDRSESMTDAFRALGEVAKTRSLQDRILTTVLLNDALSQDLRLNVWWSFLLHFSDANDTELFEKWSPHAIRGIANTDTQNRLAALSDWMKVDRRDPAAVLAFTSKMSEPEVTSFRKLLIGSAFRTLCWQGRKVQVDAFLDGIAQWKLDSSIQGDAASLRLEYARQWRNIKDQNAVLEQMRLALAKSFPSAPSQMPAWLADQRREYGMGEFPEGAPDETFAAAHYVLNHPELLGHYDPFSVWSALFRASRNRPNIAQTIEDVLSAAFEAADSDSQRFEIGLLIAKAVDVDIAQCLGVLVRNEKQWINFNEYPDSSLALQVFIDETAYRVGRKSNGLATAKASSSPIAQTFIQGLELMDASRSNDRKRLKRYFDETSATTLTREDLLPFALSAAKRIGATEEASVLEQAMRRYVRRTVTTVWATQGTNEAFTLASGLLTFAEPDDIPERFAQEMIKHHPSPIVKHLARIMRAQVTSDWKSVNEESELLLAEQPTAHPIRFLRAQALARLGEPELAKIELAKYLQFCREDPNYRTALDLALSWKMPLPQ